MTILLSEGATDRIIVQADKEQYIDQILAGIAQRNKEKPVKRVLLIPPDFTRFHSDSGNLCALLYDRLCEQAEIDIMPALGTHVPISEDEIRRMFGDKIPLSCFKDHDWRDDLIDLGEVSGEKISEFSGGILDYPMKVQVNKLLFEGNYDLIFSVGQVVPHEVIGMANYTKNICIGIGGADMINKSHFLGAAYGMERMMGRYDTPVRRALNHGFDEFIAHLPIVFILTVMQGTPDGLVMRGLYAGDEKDSNESFLQAAKLSQQTNLDLLDKPIKKALVLLDPEEFKSTWLGNKAIYRTRMAMADDGELIILAPGLKEFGEDKEIDRLIRKYGYKTTPETLKAVDEEEEMRDNLSAAAHLIHGSSEGRFNVTYCPGENMSQQEIESVGYQYAPYEKMAKRYKLDELKDGYNTIDDEEVFFVSNPALGLWALKEHFPA